MSEKDEALERSVIALLNLGDQTFWTDHANIHVSYLMWLLKAAGEETSPENVKRHLEGLDDAKWRVQLYLAASERTDQPETLRVVEDYFEREYMALRRYVRRIIVLTAIRTLECGFDDGVDLGEIAG